MSSSIAWTRWAKVYCQYSISTVCAEAALTIASVRPTATRSHLPIFIVRLLVWRTVAVEVERDLPESGGRCSQSASHRVNTASRRARPPGAASTGDCGGRGPWVALQAASFTVVVPGTWERSTMRIGIPIVAVLLAGVVVGCSAKDMQEWKAHPSHFASGDHMAFSLRTRARTPE